MRQDEGRGNDSGELPRDGVKGTLNCGPGRKVKVRAGERVKRGCERARR